MSLSRNFLRCFFLLKDWIFEFFTAPFAIYQNMKGNSQTDFHRFICISDTLRTVSPPRKPISCLSVQALCCDKLEHPVALLRYDMESARDTASLCRRQKERAAGLEGADTEDRSRFIMMNFPENTRENQVNSKYRFLYCSAELFQDRFLSIFL